MSSRSGRVGLGAYVFNDKNGALDRTGMQLTYAYHINMKFSQLSFGISGIAYQFSIDDSKINLLDPDLAYDNADKSIFVPDASFGYIIQIQIYMQAFLRHNYSSQHSSLELQVMQNIKCNDITI